MRFRYKALAADRKTIQGTIEAASQGSAEEALYQAGYEHILKLRESGPAGTLGGLIPSLFGVKPADVIDFSRQLATLLEAGVPLVSALQLLGEHSSRAALRDVLSAVAEDLRAGSPLSQALGRHPEFPDSFCQVLFASEQAGTLEAGLRQVASHLERKVRTGKRIRKAMTYPAVILLMAVGVVVLLMTVVLPPLLGMFEAFSVDLPLATRFVIAASEAATSYGVYLLGALALAGVSIFIYVKTPSGRYALDGFMLKVPVIGPIVVNSSMFHFCQSAAMMLRSGLPLTRAMDVVVDASGNRVVSEALGEVRHKLTQGEGLSGPLSENPIFPTMLVRMVALGETTGNMDQTLATLAEHYEEKVDQRIGALVSMIEPALTFGIGLLVAFMAMSIVTPLYSIMGSL